MSGLSRKKIIMFLTGCVLFCFSSAWLLFCYLKYQFRDTLMISAESGIYEEGTALELRIFRKGTVYYHLRGEEVQEYTEPLILSAGEDGRWYDMSFYCIFEDGTRTELQERTYYVVRAEEKPVETDYIVSVWGDEEAFFSDDKGIFVRGNQFDEYMAANPDVDILETVIPANYHSNEEFPVRSIIFDREGNSLVQQDCGLKIYGMVSRAKIRNRFD